MAIATLEQVDVASKYFILRVSQKAWQDVGARTRASRFTQEPDSSTHPLLTKFWSDCSHPAALDTGELLREVDHPKVFRLKATGPNGSYRGAIWYDRQAGVLWLLRVVALSDFHEESLAYRHFRALEEQSALFP